MKVIKITKSYRNSSHTKLMYIPDGMDAFEEDMVSNWAHSDPAGHNYGYKVEWEPVHDPEEIRRALMDRRNELENNIGRLREEIKEIDGHLFHS